MSADLLTYGKDGACESARAVLPYLQAEMSELDWHLREECGHQFPVMPKVARWENCREQGYVVTCKNQDYSGKDLNIAFFEHRNSDEICAVMWRQKFLNSPTIQNADFGDVYRDKHDVSHSVSYDKPFDMARWVAAQMRRFYGMKDED